MARKCQTLIVTTVGQGKFPHGLDHDDATGLPRVDLKSHCGFTLTKVPTVGAALPLVRLQHSG